MSPEHKSSTPVRRIAEGTAIAVIATAVLALVATVGPLYLDLPLWAILWSGLLLAVLGLALLFAILLSDIKRRAEEALAGVAAARQRASEVDKKLKRELSSTAMIELHEFRLNGVAQAARNEGFIVDRRDFEGSVSLFIRSPSGDHRSYMVWDVSRADFIKSIREMGGQMGAYPRSEDLTDESPLAED